MANEVNVFFFEDAPYATTLKSVSNNTTLPRDSNMTLNCKTDASPEAKYHFYFNGKSIGNSASGVFNVTVVSDGVYTCVPVNTVGTGDNAAVSVTVGKLITFMYYNKSYLLFSRVRGQLGTLRRVKGEGLST